MAKNTKTRKWAVNRKLIAALTLAVALVLTVVFLVLGVSGRKMDAQGLYKLLPWLPTPGQSTSWREALLPGAGLGDTLVTAFNPADGAQATPEGFDKAVQVMAFRLRDLGWTDAAVEQRDGKLVVTLPKGADAAYLKDILSQKGEFAFADPAGAVFMDGSHVISSGFGYAGTTQDSVSLSLQFDAEGKAIFATKSSELTGQSITLLRDGQVVVSPGISEPITQGVVSIPMPSLEIARDNAVLLRSGALPFALALDGESAAGSPLLGAQVQNTLIIALLVFLAVVCLYFLVCYRLGGLLAAWMLVLQAALSYFFAALMGAGYTLLTLVAIMAAFLVTTFALFNLYLGMRGDVLRGRSVRQALHEGYAAQGHASLDIFVGLVLVGVVLIILDGGIIRLLFTVFTVCLLVGLALVHLLLRLLYNEALQVFGGNASLYLTAPTQKKEG